MDVFCRLYLTMMGLIFACVGLLGLCAPHLLFEPLGLVTLGVSAKAELRAAYGGTFLASSSAAFLALRQPSYAQLVLTLFATTLGVFSAARAVSLLIDGRPNVFSIVMHVLESFGFILTLIALQRIVGATPQEQSV